MNRILTCGLAAMVTTFLAQPVYADHHGGGGGRGGGGGGSRGGGGHVSAPAHFSAPRAQSFHANVMRAPSVPHIAYSRPAPTFHAPSAPRTTFRSAPLARTTAPRTAISPSVTRSGRTFAQPQRNAPSIAFGGHSINNNAAVNAPNMARGARNAAPPSDVTSGWNRGSTHEWHHHHFRFNNGGWVIIDPGFGFDYGDDYGYPYYNEPAPYAAPSYVSPAGSVVASVQDQLNRLGYSAGDVDGVMGPQTQDAIADFQNDHRMPPTGQIDGGLLQALGLQ